MKRFLVLELPTSRSPTNLPKEEVDHARKVLRLESGDWVEAIDGQGTSVTAQIHFEKGNAHLAWIEGQSVIRHEPPRAIVPLCLNMCLIKADPFEWVIEKAVELGVATLRPIEAERSVVEITKKGVDHFKIRWQKIADQALKQCGRLTRMTLLDPMSLEDLVFKYKDYLLLAQPGSEHARIEEDLDLEPSGKTGLIIGPEGGFTQTELTLMNGIRKVSFGPLVLRAETAALYGVSLIAHRFRY